MDWRRIKTQLIIVLLILNIVLLGKYYREIVESRPFQVSKDNLEEFKRSLSDVGIGLDMDFPQNTENLGTLIVQYEEAVPMEINDRYFQGSAEIENTSELVRLKKDHEEIVIINNRRLLYENLSQNEVETTSSPEEIAIEFLRDRDHPYHDLVLVNKKIRDDHVELEYVKSYGDQIIETCETRFIIKNGRVHTMDRLWIDVIEESDTVVNIEPSYKAVLSLLNREEFYGKNINDIRMCYYFDPEAQGVLEDNTKAKRGRAIPAWRISFEDGTVEVVDNY